MKIAYTMALGKGDMDLLLHGFATEAMNRGLRVCGTVQINTERATDRKCDMDVRVLPDGPTLRISQSLGKNARGCRLDPEALECAVEEVGRALEHGTDLLIVNKFGKHEAEGRGFREVIARAMMAEIPILVGVNAMNEDAFHEFAGGMAEKVPPTHDALNHWLDLVVASAPTGRVA